MQLRLEKVAASQVPQLGIGKYLTTLALIGLRLQGLELSLDGNNLFHFICWIMSSSFGRHKRLSSDGVDPFSDPDVYYGDPTLLERQARGHRRAHSSVCPTIFPNTSFAVANNL